MKISTRAGRIEPFYVMEVAKAASELAREVAHSSRPMIFLNIGEPDFTAPPVQEAAERAIRDGAPSTPRPPACRRCASASALVRQRFGVDVPARRIVITAGASAALQLACLALIDAGDEVLMPDPSYPCNRHFVSAAEGKAVLMPTTAAERFQLSADKVRGLDARTRGVLLASPPTPRAPRCTPTSCAASTTWCARGGITIVDEIYLGLSYDDTLANRPGHRRHIISINSFSKYFNMTGWRLGWMVVPEAWCRWSSAGPEPVHLRQHRVAACRPGLLRARKHGRVRAPPRRVQGPARLLHPGARSWACPCPSSPTAPSTPGPTAALPRRWA
jgi:aspartate/methionine/tyrosine aminotransferase